MFDSDEDMIYGTDREDEGSLSPLNRLLPVSAAAPGFSQMQANNRAGEAERASSMGFAQKHEQHVVN